ncbi:MAG: hypothetical protein A3F18_03760 [Legionellales bacterium RIFCSPHIGHO2_12_FULL_37_14]|nr:MAG: hypothetical protein A3F18_03760 [Legionellales bacterium RIFCSPHIGHO2_12_FULL_37_14]
MSKLVGYCEIAAHYFLKCMPISWCSWLGGFLGRIIGPLHKEVNQRLQRNIQHLRPDLTQEQEIQKIINNYWSNYGRVMAEFSVLRRIWRSNRVKVYGIKNLEEAMSHKRPIILLFLHLANWEVVGPKFLETSRQKTIQIYQLIEDPIKLKIAQRVRKPYEKYLIPNSPNVAIKIHRKLKQGYNLSLAVDEFIQDRLVIPSFGREINSTSNLTFAVRLAKLVNAILMPAYAVRTKGAHFNLHFEPPVMLNFANFDAQKLHKTVRQLDKLIDPIIRKHIDQWYYAIALELAPLI